MPIRGPKGESGSLPLCLSGSPCPPCSLTQEGPGTKQALHSRCVWSWGLTALCGSILGRSMAIVMQLRKMMTRTTWSNILWVMIRWHRRRNLLQDRGQG